MNTLFFSLGDPLLTILWMLVAFAAVIIMEMSSFRMRP